MLPKLIVINVKHKKKICCYTNDAFDKTVMQNVSQFFIYQTLTHIFL